MLKVKIITIGKTKEKWLNEAILEYEKRLKNKICFEWTFVKDKDKLFHLIYKKKFIALDPNGSCLDSLEFSKHLFILFEQLQSEILFVIGGSEGIPKELLQLANQILSFSKLTFTHQMTRLILIEQVYRAYQIHYGRKSYHK